MLLAGLLAFSSMAVPAYGEVVSENGLEGGFATECVSENDLSADTLDGELIQVQETDSLEESVLIEDSLLASDGAMDGMNIYAIWVGGASGNIKGDCTLIESNGEYLLMDMGSIESYDNVKAFLNQLGVKKLSLYFSHMHADHTGGIDVGMGYDKLLHDFTVENVYLPAEPMCDTDHYQRISLRYMKAYNDSQWNLAYHKLNVGSKFTVGAASFEVLGPLDVGTLTAAKDEKVKENNMSLATKVTCGNVSFLTCGDCLEEQEGRLVAKYGAKLKADIYKMDHHGWSSGNTAEFLNCVQPKVSFACSTGATDFNTDKNGLKYRETRSARRMAIKSGISFMTGDEGDSLKIETKKDGSIRLYRMKAPSSPLVGWVTLAGGENEKQLTDTYYINSDGSTKKGFQVIDGKLYDFGTGGCMKRGTYVSDGKGGFSYNGWVKYENKDGSYDMRYFDEKTGEIKRGLLTIGSDTYALDPENGARLKGIQKIGNDYYFVANTGVIRKNGFCYLNNQKYYADKDGKLATGITKVDGKLYLFSETGEAIKASASAPLMEIGGKYYYVGTDGSIKTGVSFTENGVVYKFDKNGKLVNVPKVNKPSISKVTAKKKSLEVKWKKTSGAAGYVIYISTKKSGGYKEAKVIKKGTVAKATIKKLKSGKTYYVKIRAYKKLRGSKIYSKDSKVKKVKVK